MKNEEGCFFSFLLVLLCFGVMIVSIGNAVKHAELQEKLEQLKEEMKTLKGEK